MCRQKMKSSLNYENISEVIEFYKKLIENFMIYEEEKYGDLRLEYKELKVNLLNNYIKKFQNFKNFDK
jgi:hypothetical protein